MLRQRERESTLNRTLPAAVRDSFWPPRHRRLGTACKASHDSTSIVEERKAMSDEDVKELLLHR